MDRLRFPLPMPLSPSRLAAETLGTGTWIQTPYGRRQLLYADYTASGRSLRFVEEEMLAIGETYANTHTEDNETGAATTRLYREARQEIRARLGGSESYVVVLAGTGATGAIHRLTQILGVHESPASRQRRQYAEAALAASDPEAAAVIARLRCLRQRHRPVVFLTPYEHHSNVLPWREADADVVEIDLTPGGEPDLADLEHKVSLPQYAQRLKIGSFSAASNVTGQISPVREMARILHRHCGLAFFDYAASAPYVPITLWASESDFLDGVFLSPHKFIGGPGSSGLLVFHKRIYNESLSPSLPGGGTVDYVNASAQDYKHDVETREDGGTPAILQAMRIAMAMRIKDAVGVAEIARLEQDFRKRALEAWSGHPNFAGIGLDNEGQDNHLAILSFNLRYGTGFLHPRFVTRLLNDLFGIQARAGCSCAGPFGHRLLGIGEEKSARFREVIRTGCEAMKPGWVRIGFHYTMDGQTFEAIVGAVLFLADHGADFLPDYDLDPGSGLWTNRRVRADSGKTGLAGLIPEAGRLRPVPDAEPHPFPFYGTERWPDLAWFPVAHQKAATPTHPV